MEQVPTRQPGHEWIALAIPEVQNEVQRFLGRAIDIFSLSTCSAAILAASNARENGWKHLCMRDFAGFVVSAPIVHGPDGCWQKLFHRLTKLEVIQWRDDKEGKASSAGFTSDRNTYSLTRDATFVIRSGGKYFFGVSIVSVDSIAMTDVAIDGLAAGGGGADVGAVEAAGEREGETLRADGENECGDQVQVARSNDDEKEKDDKGEGVGNKEDSTASLIEAPCLRPAGWKMATGSKKVNAIKWRRLKIGKVSTDDESNPYLSGGPPPKYHHSVTELECSATTGGSLGGRSFVVFGGQHGGNEFTQEMTTNELHILTGLYRPRPASQSTVKKNGKEVDAVWSLPLELKGSLPPPRRGHTALRLPSVFERGTAATEDQIAIIGGSLTSLPIHSLDIFILSVTAAAIEKKSEGEAVVNDVGNGGGASCEGASEGLLQKDGGRVARQRNDLRSGQQGFLCRWSKVVVDSGPDPFPFTGEKNRTEQPPGRFFHSCYAEGTSEHSHGPPSVDLVIFGGQQLQVTLGYLDSWMAHVSFSGGAHAGGDQTAPEVQEQEASGSGVWKVRWRNLQLRSASVSSEVELATGVSSEGSSQAMSSSRMQRRGHSSFAVGKQLLVFGGAEAARVNSDDSDRAPWRLCAADVMILESGRRWRQAKVDDQSDAPPAPRKGHSTKLVGGAMLISGGYDETGGRHDDKKGHELLLC